MRVSRLAIHVAVIGLIYCAVSSLAYTETEFVSQNSSPDGRITIAVGPELPPLLHREADGRLTGFVIDFLSEAARRAGRPIDFVYLPDEAALRALSPERTPLLSWLLSEETMKGWLHFERSYLTLHTAVFRRHDSVDQRELVATDLGEIIAVEGSEAHRDLLDDGAIKIFTVPTIDDAVQLLASGRHDTIFANQMAVLDAIRRLRLDSIVEVPSPEMHMHQRIRLHRTESRADLESALAPILHSMRHDGGFDTAYNHWFGPLDPEPNVSRRVFALTVGSVALGGALLGLVLFVSRRRLVALTRGLGEDLRTSESRLGGLLGDVEAIVWESTPDGSFTYVSPYAETVIGYKPELWLRLNFLEGVLLHPEDRAATLAARREAVQSGQDLRSEYRAVAASGKVLWLHDVIHVVKDEAGRPFCLRGVTVDVTARKNSEDAIHESEARLAAIMDASPTGIFRLDGEGRVTFGNQEAARITGIESGPVDLTRWLQAIHPDDRRDVTAAWKRVREEDVPDHREYRFVHPDGEVVWVLDRGVPERDASGRITGFVGTLTDITQIKRNEQTIRTHSQVFLNMQEGVNTVDENRNILYANAAFEKMFGYGPGELIGQNVSVLSPASPTEYEQRRADIRRELVEHGSWSGEMRNRRKGGSVFWTRVHISRVEGVGPTYAVVVQEDITDAKQAREALRESEEKFRRVAESALVGIAITDHGHFTFSNDAMIHLTGYTPKDLDSLNREEVAKLLMGEEFQASAYAALVRLDDAGSSTEPVVFEEAHLRHRDGSDRWARLTVSRLFPDRPFPRLFVAVDITARKRAEQSVRTHSQVLMSMAEGVVFTDDAGVLLETNPAFDAMFGYSAGELAGQHVSVISDATRGEVGDRIRQISASIVAAGVWTGIFRNKRKDGSRIWTRARMTLTEIDGKNVFVSVQEDITEALRAEEALKESEEKFRRVAESALVGIALYDGEQYTFVNRAMMAFFGQDDVDAIRRLDRQRLAELFFHGPDKGRILDALQRLDNQEGELTPVVLDDVRVKSKDGTDRWASVMFNRLYPDRLYPRVTVCVDTTQRKRAELALSESEQKFRRVAESAMVGLAIADGQRYTYVNDALMEMTGYGREELASLDRAGRISALFEPDDARRVAETASVADVATGGLPSTKFPEMRLRRKDGTYRWVSVLVNPMYADRPYPVLIAVVDVTERRLATEALRASEASLRRTEQLARIGGWEFRADGTAGGWSDGVRRIHEVAEDYTPALESGLAFFTPADREKLLALGAEAMRVGTPWQFEGELTTAKGRQIWVRSTGEPIRENGQIVGLVGAIQDVTDLRKAEVSLRESEQRLRAIVESEPECVKLVDEHSVLLEMNPAGLAAIEAESIEQVRGLSVLDLMAPEYREMFQRGVAEVFAGKATQGEFEIIGLKGTRRWMDQSAVPLWDTDRPGHVKQMLAVTRDVTERKRIEEALRESETLFRAISEQMADCLLLIDLDDPEVPARIVYANGAAARMYGAVRDKLIGLSTSELDTPETARLKLGRIAQLLNGETLYFEGEHRRMDGSVMPFETVVHKIAGLGGNKVLAIGRDISDRRKAEEERRRIEARMQQTQRLESLGVLTGGIAHDFNNLLAGILGHADLAREDAPATGPVRESIEQIEIAARRAADLVHQMLAYSGRGSFVVRRVRLGEMVRELSKLLEVTLSKKAALRFELDDTAPPIAADAAQIQQVVMNLITNASDALGDQPGTITLRSGTVEYTKEALSAYTPHEPPHPGLFVFLEVSDTGCGMDPATLDRIFDPFFSTKFTGRGLGLAAALGIIRGHHGGLRVTSRVGHGTTFRVIFPAAIGDEAIEASPPAEPGDTLRRAGTILIVDDEPRVRDFLVRALQRFGHETFVAADGRQALEVFDRYQGRIDAVLLDITMPEMGGGEVLRALHEQRPELPVILMSGFTEAETRQGLEHNGYAGFLQKPFSLETLRAAVDALLVQK